MANRENNTKAPKNKLGLALRPSSILSLPQSNLSPTTKHLDKKVTNDTGRSFDASHLASPQQRKSVLSARSHDIPPMNGLPGTPGLPRSLSKFSRSEREKMEVKGILKRRIESFRTQAQQNVEPQSAGRKSVTFNKKNAVHIVESLKQYYHEDQVKSDECFVSGTCSIM